LRNDALGHNFVNVHLIPHTVYLASFEGL
jgi:hypothetical protein